MQIWVIVNKACLHIFDCLFIYETLFWITEIEVNKHYNSKIATKQSAFAYFVCFCYHFLQLYALC